MNTFNEKINIFLNSCENEKIFNISSWDELFKLIGFKKEENIDFYISKQGAPFYINKFCINFKVPKKFIEDNKDKFDIVTLLENDVIPTKTIEDCLLDEYDCLIEKLCENKIVLNDYLYLKYWNKYSIQFCTYVNLPISFLDKNYEIFSDKEKRLICTYQNLDKNFILKHFDDIKKYLKQKDLVSFEQTHMNKMYI